MKALNELIKMTTLENALIIEDEAARAGLVEVEDILALASV